ncbi:MAG: MotA/TolQ/ExbB proton channel family protein [Candidatus Omnitrophota bacterium]
MFKNFSIWDALRVGGPVMYFLICCSVVSIAIIAERILFYSLRSKTSRVNFMRLIRKELEENDIKKAQTTCHKTLTPFSEVVAAGLNASHGDEKEIADAMERQIIIEVNILERRTAIVGTIGSTAVYIGLLGTVWGIIEAFRDIAQMGSGGINVVIHGIAAALVCTAAGLFVAIPAVAAYNYFVKRVNGFVMDMELCASEVAGLLKGHKKTRVKNEKTA